ncbi:hypothetical conserved protein (plasmid) [Rhizobium etli CFN 42]|uniref:Hypothetical conserved protein n=1 Tax=Rhizobium etli (strain ATCC 51251 / DSM 11541 / JCM 21823 / NBRC 15573 / CFN 42) TaxID=347834 RepID=Q2JZW1_RHIEC|nr:hypothetical protein [Rhizobium etli]ABC93863.1 hypothetical conserved protein [Rhizobium etli CFN 42]
MNVRYALFYSALLLLEGGHAQAQAIEKESTSATVISGSRTVIYQSSFVHPDCTTAALPRLKVLDGGKHGKIQIVHEKVFPNFARSSPRYKCNGRKVDGAVVYYTPGAGFTGSDKVRLRESSESEAGVWEITARVTVVD